MDGTQSVPDVRSHAERGNEGQIFGAVAIALRMIASTSSRSRPTSGSRGGRVVSVP